LKLVTLELMPHSCLGNPCFGPTRDSVAEMVLKTAKVVLGLSSYIGTYIFFLFCSRLTTLFVLVIYDVRISS
jgi:hypothetical protein